jgi:tetraacyldisaccharide 4'-kinase
VNLLSALYSSATQMRNDLYDRGLLRTRRLEQPVVSVGNLSVGGSGKTPFVILLGELLKARNLSFDVLSRGYGRRTRGVLEVDPNGTPEDFGDEPLLIARRLACPVIVGESRYAAGWYAAKRFGSRLHILDDGFQHRALARDFDIVLVTAEDLRDTPLPIGRLREPLDALARSDALVVANGLELPSALVAGKSVWKVRRGVWLGNAPERPVLFCGIARPHRLLEQLRELSIAPVATKFYRDHHHYSERDIRELRALRDQNHAGGFITTEKDAVNLRTRIAQLGRVTIARVTMELDEAPAAVDTLLRVVRERRAWS